MNIESIQSNNAIDTIFCLVQKALFGIQICIHLRNDILELKINLDVPICYVRKFMYADTETKLCAAMQEPL